MNEFKLLKPRNLQEACRLLAEHKGRAKIISGGQSLVPLLKGGYIEPEYIIDLKSSKGLSYIKEEDGGIKIGALTTHRILETTPIIKKKLPVLVEAENRLAHRQIRNWGTIGGALSHGDPGGDLGPSLIALGARVKANSIRGERQIEMAGFYEGIFSTVLEEDEILSEIFIPSMPRHSAAAYQKEAIEEGDYPICSVAVFVTLDTQGETIKDAKIVLGAVGPTPIIAQKAGQSLIGKKVNSISAEQTGAIAMGEADPTTDVLGSAEYKHELIRLLTRDMLIKAVERAQKG